ncbi:MAG TPA: CHASE4 domain-containing protein [Terriglobales bacterium]|nr:CHASE4 domain-containing protein [Terriglobales bacterium]
MGPLRPPPLRFQSSLRGKTLVIVLLTMIGLVGGLFAVSWVVLMNGFTNIEEDFASENLGRASSALANELETLGRTTSEYAAWDQSYAYLHGKNPTYVKTEFPASTFMQLKVNFVIILDASGHQVFSKAFSLAKQEEAQLPSGLEEHLRPSSILATHNSESSKAAGILMLPSGPVLIDSRPVLKSNSEGPIAGTMIMGRLLDKGEIQRLSEMTRTPIEIARLDEDLPADFRVALTSISAERPTVTRTYDKESLAAYQKLNDIDGKPALVLRVLLPRTIYRQGHTSLLQFLMLLVAAGLIFGAATLYLLERVVLSRVRTLTEDITSIGASGDPSARLAVPGTDEIAYLGNAINAMLEDLETSQLDRHEGRTRLDALMEKMPAVLWTTDAELRFTSGMGAGLEILGLVSGEMAGKSLYEYFHTDDPEFLAIAAHRKALAGERVTYELDWQKHVFESHVQPLRSTEGVVIGVIGVALDITDRKHLADQLRVSQKMQAVGELAGGVAHDFNNLLMIVKGHAEMLLDRIADSSPARHNLEQIQGATDRAATLTRQLLAFSRKQVLQPKVIDLNDVVAGMIKMFARVIGENIELAFLPGSKLASVKADPGQMEQVLLNLVVNARDAMPDGGRLTIETSNVEVDRVSASQHPAMEAGSYVVLVVSDTGCGMDAGTQARIFEPFFTTKGHGKGTGLGLATVYGVVKQSGGFIWVYSEVDRGTTFKIYLPQVTADVDRLVAEKASSGPTPGTETVLFVEDEESVREVVRDYLGRSGYRVLHAADGIQALETAGAHKGPIHILVTDVVMPRLSGRELVTRLSAARPDLKVLYISGYTDDSIFRHGVLEGGVAFLQKPFNLKDLAQKIREVLDGEPAATVAPGLSRRN